MITNFRGSIREVPKVYGSVRVIVAIDPSLPELSSTVQSTQNTQADGRDGTNVLLSSALI